MAKNMNCTQSLSQNKREGDTPHFIARIRTMKILNPLVLQEKKTSCQCNV